MLTWVLTAVIGFATLAAQADAESAKSNAEIARAIGQLGAPSFEMRQSATMLLWKAGSAAEVPLREALKSTDPEIRARATALLTKLRLGIRPDTPPEVIVLIDQFRYGSDPAARRQALTELQNRGQWQAILTLIRGEPDADERQNLAQIAAAEAGKLVRPLVERGDLDQAEQILELIATSESGLSQLAAFLLLTGRLDDQIQAARDRTTATPSDAEWTRLAYLLRAKGEMGQASDAAAKTSDLVLQANLLAEARRFDAAGAVAAELFRRNPTRLETAAFGAAYYRLAGNSAEETRITEALLKAANVDRLQQNLPVERPADPFEAPRSNIGMNNLWTAAETLLVNERIDEALPILRKTNPRFAHAIYWRQHRHREALEFVGITADKPLDRAWFDKLPAPSVDPVAQQQIRFSLAAQVARQLRELGLHEQVEQVVETLRGLVSTPDRANRLTILAVLAWQIGKYDEMARAAAEAIAAGGPPLAVFSAIIKQQGALADFWYEQWLNDDPLADREQTFAKALWLVVAQPPRGRLPENWRQVATAGHAAAQKLPPLAKSQRLVLIAQTCQVRGDRELARQYLAEAAEADPSAATKAGDLALAASDWPLAASYYAQAVQASPNDVVAIYLHGYALAKTGDAKAGAKQTRLASLVALAPETRLALAVALQERGLTKDAVEQFGIVRRTALPDSPAASTASQFVGNLLNRDQPLVAAEGWEQLRLHVLNANSNFTEVEAYLSLSHFIHKARVKAANAAHEANKATAELAACDKLLPADIRLLVEAIPSFHQSGMTAVADPLFERGLAIHQRICDEFPKSATYHNNAAWLCARSQRKLDEALALVEKALQLAPDEAAYHDTLAEVQFQRGNREAAVAAAQKALELAPENKLFASRLKHFQTHELKTLDATAE